MRGVVELSRVTVTYPGTDRPVLRDVDLELPEGELALLIGGTGAGKSTLLRAVCGLVPHFTGGTLAGHVLVDGRDTRTHLPRDLADVVGVVGQDPVAGFVTDTVEDELAYAMEQIGVPGDVMRRRVEEVLDLLGLVPLRARPLADLSGGEQQRVAIGAVLTPHPRVLVLDEPTSALDPAAAEEVLAALTRLVHDLGMTVLVAEHRLERVVQYADRVVEVRPDGTVRSGDPATVLADSLVAPPVVELGRLAGWYPLPLSVREARRRAAGFRKGLALDAGPGADTVGARSEAGSAVLGRTDLPAASGQAGARPAPLLAARGLGVRHGRRASAVHAVRGVDLELAPGEVVALMGRNGAGKSTLLWALQGTGTRTSGTVTVAATDGTGASTPVDPATLDAATARRSIALVPHEPAALLFRDTVADECAAADPPDAPGEARALLESLAPGVDDAAHPRDLSEGQRLALALAIQLAARPPVLLLDEPTRGLDYAAKDLLAAVLRRHAEAGGAVVASSHDVEFVAECADRVVLLADGEVVTDGPAAQVLVSSPVFAPQVAKVLRPTDLLTVSAVRARLGVLR